MQLQHPGSQKGQGATGRCLGPTSTRHSSGGLALKEVGVCSQHSGVLLETAVQFHMEPILILLLYGSALSVFRPFLHTQKKQEILYSLHFQVTHLLTYIITPFDWNVVSDLSPQMRHTSPRKSSTQVQEKMNLPRRQKNEKCVDMSNNIQLQSKACKTPC